MNKTPPLFCSLGIDRCSADSEGDDLRNAVNRLD